MEWDILAAWVVGFNLYSDNNVWLIQIPRLYNIYKVGQWGTRGNAPRGCDVMGHTTNSTLLPQRWPPHPVPSRPVLSVISACLA